MNINFLTADEIQSIKDFYSRSCKSYLMRVGCSALGRGVNGLVGITDGRKVAFSLTVEQAIAVCNGDMVVLKNGTFRASTPAERAERIDLYFGDFDLVGDALLDFAVALVESGDTSVPAIREAMRAAGLPLKGAWIRNVVDACAALA